MLTQNLLNYIKEMNLLDKIQKRFRAGIFFFLQGMKHFERERDEGALSIVPLVNLARMPS